MLSGRNIYIIILLCFCFQEITCHVFVLIILKTRKKWLRLLLCLQFEAPSSIIQSLRETAGILLSDWNRNISSAELKFSSNSACWNIVQTTCQIKSLFFKYTNLLVWHELNAYRLGLVRALLRIPPSLLLLWPCIPNCLSLCRKRSRLWASATIQTLCPIIPPLWWRMNCGWWWSCSVVVSSLLLFELLLANSYLHLVFDFPFIVTFAFYLR